MQLSDESFWTTFLLEGYAADELHCTHKYFARLSDGEAWRVFRILSEFFSPKAYTAEPFLIKFDHADMFGPEHNTRVLVLDKESTVTILLGFGALRFQLDKFREDEWHYTPHVTSPDVSVHGKFLVCGYALMKGKTCMAAWYF